ncbi:glycosyltransferase [Thioclava sp.]|uniref:glycosyltransferase n=1 Tax=Thioclava sp. TaxID=1933450 RepID=UPI003AA8C9A5
MPNTPTRILFGSAHPYLPQLHGGAQSSTHELVIRLRAAGYPVAVLAGLTGEGWTGLRARVGLKLGRAYMRDDVMGYPVYRTWFPETAVAAVARDFKADVAILQSGFPVRMARAIDRDAVRTFIYLRNVEQDDLGGAPGTLSKTQFIANSQFTARHFAQTDGLEAQVVLPLIEGARYRVTPARRNVTFVNPHAHKGVDVALAIAKRCPDIPFVFIKAWKLSAQEDTALRSATASLANVTLREPVRDMRPIYADAAIILAPSRWDEAFGRIAAEAHVSAIPVVGSNRGGLPEAIGPGGVILDPDGPIEPWVDAIQRLWSDADHYAAVSSAARTYSQRPELNSDAQIAALLKIIGAQTYSERS